MPFEWINETVTVIRAVMVTSNHRTERDWANAQTHVVENCVVQKAASSTDFADPARVRSIDRTLIAPYGADIEEGDRIVSCGRTYVIDGLPTDVRSPSGAVSHMEADLVAWSG